MVDDNVLAVHYGGEDVTGSVAGDLNVWNAMRSLIFAPQPGALYWIGVNGSDVSSFWCKYHFQGHTSMLRLRLTRYQLSLKRVNMGRLNWYIYVVSLHTPETQKYVSLLALLQTKGPEN